MTERAFYREVLESTLPDREAVRRLCLETSEIPVAGHRRKGGHFPVVRWAAGCLLALVLAAGGAAWKSGRWEPSAGSPALTDSSETAGASGTDEGETADGSAQAAWESLTFYSLSQTPSWEYNYIALLWEDFVPMSLEELKEYFQLPFQPQVLDGYSLQEDPEDPYGLFRRSSGENAGKVYHDFNCLEYREAGGEGVLWLSFNRVFPELFRLSEPSEGETTASVLHSARFGELPVTLYRWEEAASYYAQFRIGETAYWVQSEKMSQESFLAALEMLVG